MFILYTVIYSVDSRISSSGVYVHQKTVEGRVKGIFIYVFDKTPEHVYVFAKTQGNINKDK